MVNSPKWESLTGFLHGHPETDETGDQTAGQREERVDEWVQRKITSHRRKGGRQTDTERRRTGEVKKKNERDKWKTTKTEKTQRSAKVHFIFNLSFIHSISELIFHEWKFPSKLQHSHTGSMFSHIWFGFCVCHFLTEPRTYETFELLSVCWHRSLITLTRFFPLSSTLILIFREHSWQEKLVLMMMLPKGSRDSPEQVEDGQVGVGS